MRGVAAEGEVRGQSDAAAARELPAPADLAGDALEHRAQPRRAELRPAVLAVVEHAVGTQHRETERERVLAGGMRDLVHEALDDEGVRRVRRGAP